MRFTLAAFRRFFFGVRRLRHFAIRSEVHRTEKLPAGFPSVPDYNRAHVRRHAIAQRH